MVIYIVYYFIYNQTHYQLTRIVKIGFHKSLHDLDIPAMLECSSTADSFAGKGSYGHTVEYEIEVYHSMSISLKNYVQGNLNNQLIYQYQMAQILQWILS